MSFQGSKVSILCLRRFGNAESASAPKVPTKLSSRLCQNSAIQFEDAHGSGLATLPSPHICIVTEGALQLDHAASGKEDRAY
jgi:hypothetical protein